MPDLGATPRACFEKYVDSSASLQPVSEIVLNEPCSHRSFDSRKITRHQRANRGSIQQRRNCENIPRCSSDHAAEQTPLALLRPRRRHCRHDGLGRQTCSKSKCAVVEVLLDWQDCRDGWHSSRCVRQFSSSVCCQTNGHVQIRHDLALRPLVHYRYLPSTRIEGRERYQSSSEPVTAKRPDET